MLPIVSKTPVSKIKSSTFLEPKREVINNHRMEEKVKTEKKPKKEVKKKNYE